MPYSVEDKKRATTRLRRIKGQVEALERAVDAGTECRLLLQQIACWFPCGTEPVGVRIKSWTAS